MAAADHMAAGAGVEMLRRGGSAADAAVAAGAVIAVTCQHMNGLGGDLLAVVVGPGGPPAALVASGRAGSGADPDRLRARGMTSMPARGDIASVPVPGCVDGWVALHGRFGRLPLAEVLAPAARYAAEGFAASPTLAVSAATVADLPGADDFARPLLPGSAVRRPGVARCLEAVMAEGRDGFYGGEFGEGLLRLGAGEYEPGDLERSQASWSEPVAATATGLTLLTTPPPTQGYLTLAAAWIADQLGDLPEPDDPLWAHLLVEAMRQAGHDRLAVLHEGADGAALVSPRRLAPRAASVSGDRAATLPASFSAGGTIALVAVDSDRMGVSLLQSNAAGFGAGIVEPSTGVFLHNRGTGFSLEPGHPAEYGPGRRPPHTLSPLALTHPDGGALAGVLATMGGDSQPMILLQLLARMRSAGEDPATAVAAGRWRLTGRADDPVLSGFAAWRQQGRVTVEIEGHAPDAWDAGLDGRGHTVRRVGAWSHGFGHAQAVMVAGDGHLEAAADPRPGHGLAAGW
ncbi:MAG TPA: gamma-glutamyltransferase [Acidimicrobiales bacterium]|nr:gamma-glutamyltransferase [Acidimicrobiales bacterium]